MEETFEGVFRKKDETATTDFMCGDGSRIMKASVGVECESEFFTDASICLKADESFSLYIFDFVKAVLYTNPWMVSFVVGGFDDLSNEDKFIIMNKFAGSVAEKIKTDLMHKVEFEANECFRETINYMSGLVKITMDEWGQSQHPFWQDVQGFEKRYFNNPVGKADPFGLNK